MKKVGTYIADAFANALGQVFLFLAGLFVWHSIPGAIIWTLAAAGFGVLLSVMERGAESRRGMDFKHYLLFSVLLVNAAALVYGIISGADMLIKFHRAGGVVPVFAVTPYYPVWISLGTLWITLSFIVADRLKRRKA